MKPRAHAEIIKQWAEGADVQYRRPGSNEWVDSPDPAFVSDYEYRVKPTRVYPQTKLSIQRLIDAYRDCGDGWDGSYKYVANTAIRHAIDNGQVVTREEFATLLKERDRAVLTLQNSSYTDDGGELWKPPIGKAYEDRHARDMTVAMTVAKHIRHKCYTASQQAIGKLDLESLIAAAIS